MCLTKNHYVCPLIQTLLCIELFQVHYNRNNTVFLDFQEIIRLCVSVLVRYPNLIKHLFCGCKPCNLNQTHFSFTVLLVPASYLVMQNSAIQAETASFNQLLISRWKTTFSVLEMFIFVSMFAYTVILSSFSPFCIFILPVMGSSWL